MTTLSLTPEAMAPADEQIVNEVNHLVFSAFWPSSPPTRQDLAASLGHLAQYLRKKVSDGDLSGEQAEKIMRAYIGVIVDREFAANLQAITGAEPPNQYGFLARWAMKLKRAVL